MAIDPGQPGVPEFGRKLYNLPLLHVAHNGKVPLPPRDRAAVGAEGGGVAKPPRSGRQARSIARCAGRISSASSSMHGSAASYSTTMEPLSIRAIASTPRRAIWQANSLDFWRPASELQSRQAAATSVRRDLQACLPRSLWDRVLVGYYNGAEIAPLGDDGAPDSRDVPCGKLEALAAALRAQPELAQAAKQTDRPYQITLEAVRVLPESRLWDLAHEVIFIAGATDVCVTRSSHSIDIVATGVSKLNVVARLRQEIRQAPTLTIGDRGRWPGNDFELLKEPFSLSVDEINVDPRTCWNLAEPGQRGPAATLDYLRALKGDGGRLRFVKGGLR